MKKTLALSIAATITMFAAANTESDNVVINTFLKSAMSGNPGIHFI